MFTKGLFIIVPSCKQCLTRQERIYSGVRIEKNQWCTVYWLTEHNKRKKKEKRMEEQLYIYQNKYDRDTQNNVHENRNFGQEEHIQTKTFCINIFT